MLTDGVHIVVSEDRLRAIEQSIAQLALAFEKTAVRSVAIGDWIPESEAMRLTNLGKTTLYNLRKSGLLSCSTISGRGVFYRLSEIERILNDNEQRL